MVSDTEIVTLVSVLVAWIVMATTLNAWGTQSHDVVLQFVILVSLGILGGTLVLEQQISTS